MKKIVFILPFILLVICLFMFCESPYDKCGGEYCPRCKSTKVGHFFYGLYRPEREDSVTIAKVKEGVLIPGGCIVRDRSPKYRCYDCYLEWGKYE